MTTIEQRQRMVKLHSEGNSYAEIATQLDCSKEVVRKWVRSYKKKDR